MNATRVNVLVLLTVGDEACVVPSDQVDADPLRVPASEIVRDAGLPANELPGRRFTAIQDADGRLWNFRLVEDRRL